MPPTKKTYSFEVKLEAASRFLAGESKTDLAIEYDLSSPQVLKRWGQLLREHGQEGLRPKHKGRPPAQREPASEVESLRREIERLRAQNAYLGKLRALRQQQRRSR